MDKQNSKTRCSQRPAGDRQESLAATEARFRRAVQSNPADGDAHFNLGQLLSRSNRPAEAAACFLEVLESSPEDVEAHYLLGGVLKDLDLLEEAGDCFRQALRIDPRYGPAHGRLGVILHLLGRRAEAIAAYRQAGRLGYDSPSNRHILNALTGHRTDAPPDRYVSNLFDGYASRFDESLVAMGYEIPMLLRLALDTLSGTDRFARAVDLGCGTGFSGLPFREQTGHLTGVDLSARMLAVARSKKIYDELHQIDLVAFLTGEQELYELFLMTDVCIYLGKLDLSFNAIRQRSHPGALVLLSIEVSDQADFVLTSSGRYAHSPAYIARLAKENAMVISRRATAAIRRDQGGWIAGMIFILERV